MILATRLKERRQQLGFLACEVAEGINKSLSSYSKYEKTDCFPDSIADIRRVCNILRCKRSYLEGQSDVPDEDTQDVINGIIASLQGFPLNKMLMVHTIVEAIRKESGLH